MLSCFTIAGFLYNGKSDHSNLEELYIFGIYLWQGKQGESGPNGPPGRTGQMVSIVTVQLRLGWVSIRDWLLLPELNLVSVPWNDQEYCYFLWIGYLSITGFLNLPLPRISSGLQSPIFSLSWGEAIDELNVSPKKLKRRPSSLTIAKTWTFSFVEQSDKLPASAFPSAVPLPPLK